MGLSKKRLALVLGLALFSLIIGYAYLNSEENQIGNYVVPEINLDGWESSRISGIPEICTDNSDSSNNSSEKTDPSSKQAVTCSNNISLIRTPGYCDLDGLANATRILLSSRNGMPFQDEIALDVLEFYGSSPPIESIVDSLRKAYGYKTSFESSGKTIKRFSLVEVRFMISPSNDSEENRTISIGNPDAMALLYKNGTNATINLDAFQDNGRIFLLSYNDEHAPQAQAILDSLAISSET